MNKGQTYNKKSPVLITASSILYEGGGSTVESWLKNLFLKVYPVGTIYTSVLNTNPSNYFGGTWEVYGSGRCLVGVDTGQSEFNTVQKTGGNKYMQSHYHYLAATGATIDGTDLSSNPEKSLAYYATRAASDLPYSLRANAANQTPTYGRSGISGGGDTQNLQPYITVYFWKRTA